MNDINESIKENSNLVKYIINKKFPYLNEDDDIYQMGLIGLWHAIETYSNKKYTFSTYASKCIYNEILLYIKKGQTKKRKINTEDILSLNYKYDDKNDVGRELLEIEYNDDYSNIIFAQVYKPFFLSLRENYRFVILSYIIGYTQKEIAFKMNVSQKRISKIITDIRKSLLIYLEENDVAEPTFIKYGIT